MHTNTDNTEVMNAERCRNCNRDDCPNPRRMPVYKGAGNLHDMVPERYWYCTVDAWHAAREAFYARKRGDFVEPLRETAEQVHRATGLPTDHPHTIDEVARLHGVSVPAARTALVEHTPLASKWRNIREVSAQDYPDEDLWLIDGVVPRGTVTVFAGKSKAGKSRLAMEAARALVTGDPFLGEHVVVSRCPVVFLCGDDSDRALGALFKSFAEQFGLTGDVSLIANPDLDLLGPSPLAELYGHLRAHVDGGGVAPLVVFDSLYNFTPSMDDNDRAQVKTVMGLLGHLAGSGLVAGVLVVDHSAKVGQAAAGADAVLGSQAKGGMARSGVNVEVVGERQREDGAFVQVTRLVRWGNSGRGWNVKYDNHAPTFEWVKADDEDSLADKAAELVKAGGGSLPLKDLGEALGHPRTNETGNPVRKAVEGDARFDVTQPAARKPWVVTLADEADPSIA